MSEQNKNLPHYFYLPSKPEIQAPDNVHWFGTEQFKATLQKVAESLHTDTQDNNKVINSIPDIWARPIFFKTALLDGNVNHSVILKEWKAILSCFALKEMMNLNISFELINIGKIPSLKYGNLQNALIKLKPKEINWDSDNNKSNDLTWSDVILIYLNRSGRNELIGSFSPLTLIYSRTPIDGNSNNILSDFYNSITNFEGKTPKRSDFENLYVLKKWVDQITSKICNLFIEEPPSTFKSMSPLFEAWSKELEGIITKINNLGSFKTFDVKESKSFFPKISDYNIPKIISILTTSYVKDIQINSECPLFLTDSLIKNPVYVVSKETLSNNDFWGLLDSYKNQNRTIDDLLSIYFSEPFGTIEENGATINWIRPDRLFFSDYLIVSKDNNGNIKGTDRIRNQFGNENKEDMDSVSDIDFILPFKKEILQYYDVSKIEKLNPKVTFNADTDSFTFSITIKVNKKDVEIQCIYGSDEWIDLNGSSLDNEQLFEIFPKYVNKFWKKHYFIYNNSDQFSFVPVYKDIPDDQSHELYEDNPVKTINIDDIDYEILIRELVRNDNTNASVFPDAVQINLNFSNNRDRSYSECGLILLSKKNKPQAESYHYEVGIDFGTTNTSVYFKEITNQTDITANSFDCESNSNKLEVKLDEYFLVIFDAFPKKEELRKKIYNEIFVTPSKIVIPTPTILRINDLTSNSERLKILIDYGFYDIKNTDFIPSNVYSDFKWSEVNNQGFFFNSLIFLIYLELLSISESERIKIRFKLTYPKIFLYQQMVSYITNWNRSISRMNQSLLVSPDCLTFWETMYIERVLNVSYNINRDEPISVGRIVTEGMASSQFYTKARDIASPNFLTMRFNLNPIVIDIGGGTTDITIWGGVDNNNENRPLFDFSLDFAGKHITNLFRKNKNIGKALFKNLKDSRIKKLDDDNVIRNETKFNVYLNGIFRDNEKDIFKQLVLDFSDPDIKWFLKMLILEFSAIIYYCSLAYYGLEKKNEIVSNNTTNIYIGGNASKFINWINLGTSQENSLAEKLFNYVFMLSYIEIGKMENLKARQFKIKLITTPGDLCKCEASAGVLDYTPPAPVKDRGILDNPLGGQISLGDDIDISDWDKKDNNDILTITHGEFLKNETIKSYESISNKTLMELCPWTASQISSKSFITFIKILNFAGFKTNIFDNDSEFDLTSSNINEIYNAIGSNFEGEKRKDTKEQKIEPIFFLQVKKYIDILLKGRV